MARRNWSAIVFLVLALILGIAAQPAAAHVLEAYGRVPLHFEEGVAGTSYLARTPGGIVALTARGFSMGIHGAPVTLSFAGARSDLQLRAVDALPGRVNAYVGADPRQWRTEVPTYARVRYEGVYPGIDVVVYGNQRQLEYDFVVAPGADPGEIRVRVDGAEALGLTTAGDLRIRRRGETIVQQAPVVYQEREGRREIVEGRYVLRGNEIAFALGAYDTRRALIIDPVVVYSTRIGGGVAAAIAVDASGHVYLAGESFGGTGYPVVNGNPHAVTGAADIFVTKLSPGGDSLVFSTFMGGTGPDRAMAIALDGAGNAWVSGVTGPNSASGNFPTTSDALVPTISGHGSEGSAALAFKLSASGTLLYSTYLQGSAAGPGGVSGSCFQGAANGVAVDASGNGYVVGFTSTSNFPTTPGAYQTSPADTPSPFICPQSRGFAVKFTPANTVGYATYLDSVGHDRATAVAVDAGGNAYITGSSDTPPFPITTNLAVGTSPAGWLVKLDPISLPIWATSLGPVPSAAALGADGTIYVAGPVSVFDNSLATLNAFQPTRKAGSEGFAARLNAGGTASLWSTYVGGSDFDMLNGVAADTDGSAWLIGTTSSSDFPTKDPSRLKGANTPEEIVTLKVSPTGALLFATYLGDGRGEGVAIDAPGNVYLTGEAGPDFTTTPGAFKSTPSSGIRDVFVLKYAAAGGGGPQYVVWTSLVKVAASGNSLTKNAGCGGCADAGAISQQTIAAGNGFVAFTVSSGFAGTVGLSTGNPGTSGKEIKFGLRFFPGYVEVRESGIWKASWNIAAADIHKVAVEGGAVKYFQNGTLKHTSAIAPTYPLLVDTSLNTVGGAVQDAVIAGAGGSGTPVDPPPSVAITAPANGATVSGTVKVTANASDNTGVTSVQFKLDGANLGAPDTTEPYSMGWNSATVSNGTHTLNAVATDTAGNTTTSAPISVTVSNAAPPPAGGNVVWTSAVRVAVSGNTITKNAGCTGCWDAGAISQQSIASGDGGVAFTVSSGAALTVGLSNGSVGTGANDIKFGLRFFGGATPYTEVRESGVWKSSWTITAGATHKVAVEGGVVKYYQNGALKYSSPVAPSYPLNVDATIETLGAAVQGAVLTTAP